MGERQLGEHEKRLRELRERRYAEIKGAKAKQTVAKKKPVTRPQKRGRR